MSRAPRALARPLGMLALTAALVAGTGQASYAASVTWNDATGDVYAVPVDGDPTPVPGETESDITSETVRHTATDVKVAVRLRSLPAKSNSLTLKIKTPIGRAYLASATAEPGMKIWLLNKGTGARVQCPGYRVGFRVATDLIDVEVPRSCLGNPRWVRIGASVSTTPSILDAIFDPSAFDPDAVSNADDVIGTVDIAGYGAVPASFWQGSGIPLPLGPKVRSH